MHRVYVACMQVFYVDHVIQDHSSHTIYHDVLNLNIENVINTVVHDEKTNQFSMKKESNKTEVTSVKLVLFKYVMSFETLTKVDQLTEIVRFG